MAHQKAVWELAGQSSAADWTKMKHRAPSRTTVITFFFLKGTERQAICRSCMDREELQNLAIKGRRKISKCEAERPEWRRLTQPDWVQSSEATNISSEVPSGYLNTKSSKLTPHRDEKLWSIPQGSEPLCIFPSSPKETSPHFISCLDSPWRKTHGHID